MEKVDNVSVTRSGWLPLLFNYGTVRIASTGVNSAIEFDMVHDPDRFRGVILKEVQRVRANRRSNELGKIRTEVRVAMEIDERPARKESAAPGGPKRNLFWQYVANNLRNFRQTVVPRSRIEQEGGAVVIYRKHWFELVNAIWAPTLLMIGLMVGCVLFVSLGFAQGAILLSLAIGLLLFTIAGVYWFYHYEDWRNDQFILDKDRIVDIDRKPFGLAASKRDVAYERVTSVQAEIKGFWNTLFNVGDVLIKTGGEGELTFNRVLDPQTIQQEIRKRVEAAQEKKRERERGERRSELAQWIGVYDEQSRLHYGRVIAPRPPDGADDPRPG